MRAASGEGTDHAQGESSDTPNGIGASAVRALRVIRDAYPFLPDDALRAPADRLGVKPLRGAAPWW
jgi:hypothetical protein